MNALIEKTLPISDELVKYLLTRLEPKYKTDMVILKSITGFVLAILLFLVVSNLIGFAAFTITFFAIAIVIISSVVDLILFLMTQANRRRVNKLRQGSMEFIEVSGNTLTFKDAGGSNINFAAMDNRLMIDSPDLHAFIVYLDGTVLPPLMTGGERLDLEKLMSNSGLDNHDITVRYIPDFPLYLDIKDSNGRSFDLVHRNLFYLQKYSVA